MGRKSNRRKFIKKSIISAASIATFSSCTSNKEDDKFKNVNINSSRIAVITILKKMGIDIKLNNKKIYKGEKNADISVKSPKHIKSINCPSKLNSGAIDEFLVIFNFLLLLIFI